MTVGLAILASGSGTILEAILEAQLPVRVVVVDRDCRSIEVAQRRSIPVEVVTRTDFSSGFDRTEYTNRLVDTLNRYNIGLVAMAGFGTILDWPIYKAFPERVLNTHPALLPDFKGWHAVRDCLQAKAKITGCTIHLATLEVDEGPILAQEVVPVLPNDTEETLHERIKEVERRLYPSTIETYLAYLDWLELQWKPDASSSAEATSRPRWIGSLGK
jgi:phosphoribosylglycinamide formyltransferase-1